MKSLTLRGFVFSRFQAAFREAALSHAILSRGRTAGEIEGRFNVLLKVGFSRMLKREREGR